MIVARRKGCLHVVLDPDARPLVVLDEGAGGALGRWSVGEARRRREGPEAPSVRWHGGTLAARARALARTRPLPPVLGFSRGLLEI